MPLDFRARSFPWAKRLFSSKTTTSTIIQNNINTLWDKIKTNRSNNNTRTRNECNSIRQLISLLLDLWIATKYESNPWRIVPLRSNEYSTTSRYRNKFYTYRVLTGLIYDLHSLGYLEIKKGVYSGNLKRMSRIRLTSKCDEIVSEWKLEYINCTNDDEEIIILRADKENNETGGLIEYMDTDETNLMRVRLQQINKVLCDADIGVVDIEVDTSCRKMKRIFNNGTFEQGGRIYGGFWQTLSQRVDDQGWEHLHREKIRIKEEEVTELDFKSYAPSIMYALEHKPRPEDAYNISGYDRDIVKKALVIMPNSSSRRSVYTSLSKKFNISRPSKLVKAVEDAHQDIAHYFFNPEAGMKVMRKDSDIAFDILYDMNVERNIVCLGIHDSFIVQRQHRGVLQEVMTRSYKKHLSVYEEDRLIYDPRVDVDIKY